ncbi:methyl-accepting chemotaxis protein [Nitrospirillum sp. BR 11163]|uniref:methyl-accepting chemotaxis protein n=1 Tax=Nitrospirillum sp. BR 11163 TaxID=3104323 RepID=UPI002AFFA078|nr:methyl-accepting chemotaxis protein [Nitrospirillum sp. BR 11163]MEA1677201.1 methyl-accepting chemotaxis protein [Nitrospirillum sp. BR 11163]
MNFINLALRPKLLAAFGGLLLLTIAISLLSLWRIGTINSAATEIRDVWLPSVDAVGDMKAFTARQRISAGRVVAAGDDKARDEAIKLYGKQTADLNAAVARFEAVGQAGEMAALYAKYQALRGPYEASMAAVFETAKQNHEQADKTMNGDIVAAFRKVQESLEALSAYDRAGAAKANDVVQSSYTHALWSIGIFAVVAVLVSAGAVLWLDRDVVQHLARLAGVMRRLAQKDYDFTLDATARRDEVGDMARAVDVFRTSMRQVDELAATQAAEAAAKTERANRVDALVQTFDTDVAQTLRSVTQASSGLHETAENLTRIADTGARDAVAVAGASEQAAANVQTVAVAAEELGASIGEIGRQVSVSATIAAKAVAEATRTNVAVTSLTEAAQQIGAVVALISDIAGQTNLLALNATIEAARAGEAGKGFAVVASEVKALANQTERATNDIRQQIESMQAATGEAASAIAAIGQTIGEIDHITTTIAAAVEEQGAATQEIARNVAEAARGTSEVSAGMNGVRQVAGETGSVAGEVLMAADDLSSQADGLRTSVSTFLAALRAA